MVGHTVDDVGNKEFCEEGGEDIEEENEGLGERGADEVQCSREDNDIENVVDEAYRWGKC